MLLEAAAVCAARRRAPFTPLRVKNCLYAHYTGPMENSQLASYKLQVHAFENDQKLTGTSYTIYVNQDSDDAVIDVFMETK